MMAHLSMGRDGQCSRWISRPLNTRTRPEDRIKEPEKRHQLERVKLIRFICISNILGYDDTTQLYHNKIVCVQSLF